MSEALLLRDAAKRLRQAGIGDPVREARKLWDASLSKRDVDDEPAKSGGREKTFEDLIDRRVAREPMSHLIGYRDFYDHRFEVGPEALDPRPDTESLVEAALEVPFSSVLDLGTGTGCILLSLLAKRPMAQGVGVDVSKAALGIAERNLLKLECDVTQDRVRFMHSDWFDMVDGSFDLIVSNPPYIAANEMAGLAPELSYEPRMALTDEGDGLSCYRIIAAHAPKHLTSGGWLMVEIGPTQGRAVAEMFRAAGLVQVGIRPDLDSRDRVVLGKKA